MTAPEHPVISRMHSLVQTWEQAGDNKAIFLRCYVMMTRNMLTALARHEFNDADWVDRLLYHFSDYYFVALDAYQSEPASAPAVWQMAHNLTQDNETTPLQNLLLGINAHINYDLVFTLIDMLEPEWRGLSQDQRTRYYNDHCHVNDIIGRTIDDVQDQVIEPGMPLMELIDTLLGPVDEYLISHLISNWREDVWKQATELLDAGPERNQLAEKVKIQALRMGRVITRLNV